MEHSTACIHIQDRFQHTLLEWFEVQRGIWYKAAFFQGGGIIFKDSLRKGRDQAVALAGFRSAKIQDELTSWYFRIPSWPLYALWFDKLTTGQMIYIENSHLCLFRHCRTSPMVSVICIFRMNVWSPCSDLILRVVSFLELTGRFSSSCSNLELKPGTHQHLAGKCSRWGTDLSLSSWAAGVSTMVSVPSVLPCETNDRALEPHSKG